MRCHRRLSSSERKERKREGRKPSKRVPRTKEPALNEALLLSALARAFFPPRKMNLLLCPAFLTLLLLLGVWGKIRWKSEIRGSEPNIFSRLKFLLKCNSSMNFFGSSLPRCRSLHFNSTIRTEAERRVTRECRTKNFFALLDCNFDSRLRLYIYVVASFFLLAFPTSS